MSRRSPSVPRPPTDRSAVVFAALGDARRLVILGRLAREGPLSITRLTDDADVSRQAITKHLDVLSDAGLVSDERNGRERLFRLEPTRLEVVRRDLDAISRRWDLAIERLRAHVER